METEPLDIAFYRPDAGGIPDRDDVQAAGQVGNVCADAAFSKDALHARFRGFLGDALQPVLRFSDCMKYREITNRMVQYPNS